MRRHNIHPEELVVVCDGRKAMILENEDQIDPPHLQLREVLEQEEFAGRARDAAGPSHLHQAGAPALSVVAHTDRGHEAERAFLATLAHHLDAAVSRDPARITLVAAPRALGMIRDAYSPALRHAVSDEVGKDWMKMSIAKIEKNLQQAKTRLQ
jgi:protein required for attachment to host cells